MRGGRPRAASLVARLSSARDGGRWNVAGHVVSRACSLLAITYVARSAGPDDIGLISMAAVVFGAVTVFGDLGVGAAIVIRRDLRDAALGGVFTAVLAVSAVTGLVLAALAVPAASFFDTTEVTGLVLVTAASLPLIGVQWFTEPLLVRRGRLDLGFVIKAGQGVVVLATVLLAPGGLSGAWAIVVGQTASAVLGAVLGLVFARPVPRPSLQLRAAWSVAKDARAFFFQGTLAYVHQNADNAFIGTNLGSRPLGLYAFNYRLAEVPYLALSDPLGQALFARASDPATAAAAVREDYYAAVRRTTDLSLPPLVALGAVGPTLVPLVLGPLWEGQAVLMALLALWGALRMVQGLQGWMANGLGLAATAAKLTAVVLLVKLPVLWLASTVSLPAVAAVMTTSVVVQFLGMSPALSRNGVVVARTLTATLPALAVCAPAAAVAWVCATQVPDPWLGAGCGIAVMVVAAVLCLATGVRAGRRAADATRAGRGSTLLERS